MYENGYESIPSFMIKCLLYNIPEHLFNNETYEGYDTETKYLKMFLDIKATIFSQQLKDWETGCRFLEINGEKDLFINKKQFTKTREFFENINLFLKKQYTWK